MAIALVGGVGATQRGMLAVQLVAIPVAAVLSLLLFFGVEKPFMRLGKQLTSSRKPVTPAEIAATAP